MAIPDIENTYDLVVCAFKASQDYQIPVIVLSDEYLATSLRSVRVERSKKEILKIRTDVDSNYVRYPYDGINIRTIPGVEKGNHFLSSWAYDQYGNFEDSSDNLKKMVERRKNIMEHIKMDKPFFYKKKSKTLIISWGSTYGAVSEGVDMLEKKGVLCSHLHFNQLYPLPDVKDILESHEKIMLVENNAHAGFGKLLRQEYNVNFSKTFVKYNARTIYPREVFEFVA